MQIRIGNKQDEAPARALVEAAYKDAGASVDLTGADSDLRGIETNCFSRDGIFLVADEERKLIGFAAAAKRKEEVLELLRLFVSSDWRKRGIGSSLLGKV